MVKFDNFPYYPTLVRMKMLVDSLIISNYGQVFFYSYVVWSQEGSAFYNGKGAGATWYDYQEWRFVLTNQISIDKAKLLGLVENDTTKAFTFLSWHFNEDKKLELFNGHFTYNVAINTKTLKHEPKGGRNRIENEFDVYVFNPWTGQFIEKQKMKSYR